MKSPPRELGVDRNCPASVIRIAQIRNNGHNSRIARRVVSKICVASTCVELCGQCFHKNVKASIENSTDQETHHIQPLPRKTTRFTAAIFQPNVSFTQFSAFLCRRVCALHAPSRPKSGAHPFRLTCPNGQGRQYRPAINAKRPGVDSVLCAHSWPYKPFHFFLTLSNFIKKNLMIAGPAPLNCGILPPTPG